MIQKSLSNTPARELPTIVESLFTTNAILCKANAEFIVNTRKPRSKKGLVTTARWLTKADADELRKNWRPKKMKREIGRSQQLIKKADTAMRKAQTALDRAQRREATQATRELKAEFERLAKVHRSLDKK